MTSRGAEPQVPGARLAYLNRYGFLMARGVRPGPGQEASNETRVIDLSVTDKSTGGTAIAADGSESGSVFVFPDAAAVAQPEIVQPTGTGVYRFQVRGSPAGAVTVSFATDTDTFVGLGFGANVDTLTLNNPQDGDEITILCIGGANFGHIVSATGDWTAADTS